MLAPAEYLQMEEDYLTRSREGAKASVFPLFRHGPRRRTTHDFIAFAGLQDVDGSASRTTTHRLGDWLTFASSRLRVRPLSLLAAALILAGTYFLGHAAYIQAKAVLAQVLLESAWQTTLATGTPTKAWAWADTWPIARISFPSLDRSQIVLEEAGGEAMAFGPAHVAASVKPGASGVSVIGGHRDTHFSFIKNLKVGDEIVIDTAERKTVRYRMTGSAIVHAGASGIATKAKSPRLALVTCYPFDAVGRGPLRYVVFAEAK
jgi:sortase A